MGLFEASGIWLVSLGKTTVHSLWMGFLILALLKLSLAFIPAIYSRLRYNLSVGALLLLFSSILATFLLLYEPISPLQKERILARGPYLFPLEAADSDSGTSLMFILFAYFYLAGVLFMLMKTTSSILYLGGLRKHTTRPELYWQKRFEQLCCGLGITRPVDFLQSTRITTPMLLGYLRPVILVPAGMITHLPVDQVETILLHELYHLKRRDYLINILQLFMEGLFFYHPAVWIISAHVRSEREHCCDDRVLHRTENPYTYAKALIHLAEKQQAGRLAPGAAGAKKHHLQTRINRIINYRNMKTTMRDKIISLALLAGSIVLMLAISGFSAGPSFTSGHRMQAIFSADQVESMHTAALLPDTIPEGKKPAGEEGIEGQDPKDIKAEMEAARKEVREAMEEIDWDAMKAEMEAAHEEARKAMEDIDWDAMKAEIEAAQKEAREAMKEIDWDAMKAEMEAAQEEARKAMKEIDWDAMKAEMEAAREDARKAMEDIDWDEIRIEMEKNISEMKVDMEKLRLDIQNSMKELNLDKIREDMEKSRVDLDSISIEMEQ
jgi:bla regulator protein BlaR1